MQNPLDEKLPAYVLVPIPLEMLENSGIDIGDMVQFASGEGIVVMVRVVIQNFLKKPVISTVFKADE